MERTTVPCPVDFDAWARGGLVLDVASGVVFVLLGLGVALVRPHRALNTWFAIFAVGYGLYWTFGNLPNFGRTNPAYAVGAIVGLALWLTGVLQVAVRYPRRPLGQARRVLLLPGLLALAHAGLYLTEGILHLARNVGETVPLPGNSSAISPAAVAFTAPAFSGLWFLLFVLAARYGVERSARDARAILLVTYGFTAFNSVSTGVYVAKTLRVPDGIDAPLWGAWIDLALAILLAAFWAWNALRAVTPLRRAAVWMAVATLALVGLGIAFAFATSLPHAENLGLLGFTRLLGVALLAYGILRMQLFDIDVRLRWGIARSFLVGIFLAVFFIVGQLVEAIAGDNLGAIAGAVASGLLLFLLHPLQKLTERMGAAAVPRARPQDAQYVLERKRDTYRNAYAMAWADGHLTAKDMRLLQQVREALALPEADVVAIERDWAASAPKA